MNLCTYKKDTAKENLIICSYCTAIQALREYVYRLPDSFPIQGIAPESPNIPAAQSASTYQARLYPSLFSQASS